MTTFTASEVRNCIQEFRDHALTVSEKADVLIMLSAFADRLEADEKAQPVTWVNPDDLHNPNFVGINAVKVGHEGLGKHYTLPLYTHPDPADAERLTSKFTDLDARDSFTVHTDTTTLQCNANAGSPPSVRFGDETPMTHYLPTPTNDSERLSEALLRNWFNLLCHAGIDAREENANSTLRRIMDIAKQVSSEIAKYENAAQAQPPDTSVTDAMVERARSAFVQADDGSTGITDAIRAALLAAQENPND